MKKIALLLDNSGSMSDNKSRLHGFLGRLDKLLTSKDAGFYGRTFTHGLGYQIHNTPADLKANYHASGGTEICVSLDQFIDTLGPDQGFTPTDKVLAIVCTDGEEGGGFDAHVAKTICDRVRTMETALRWDWLFVGTDKKAVEFSNKLGIKPGKTLQMTANHEGFAAALDSLFNIIDGWAEDKISGDDFFSEQDRQAQTVASGRTSKLI